MLLVRFDPDQMESVPRWQDRDPARQRRGELREAGRVRLYWRSRSGHSLGLRPEPQDRQGWTMLRKQILNVPPKSQTPMPGEIDVAAVATVLVTSEDPHHPVDHAFDDRRPELYGSLTRVPGPRPFDRPAWPGPEVSPLPLVT